MRKAETVTFGGSGLDRRAEWRDDQELLGKLADQAGHLAIWRGKLLFETDQSLKRLSSDDPLLALAKEPGVFLGTDGDQPLFAHDVSAWEPDEGLPETLHAFHDPSKQSVQTGSGQGAFCELRSLMGGLPPSEAEFAASAKAILGWHETHPYCSKCGQKSVVAQGGWRRDCPDCGGQHFPRTDPVVIMLITKGNSVLLGRSPGWPDGMYSLLAGFIEPGETMEAAVRREVMEESGISVGNVSYLSSQPWPFPSSLMLGCWGEALTQEVKLDPNELDDALWLSREQLMDVFAGQNPNMHAPRKGSIAAFIMEHWLKDELE